MATVCCITQWYNTKRGLLRCSTYCLGNAKALNRGTSNKYRLPRFFMCSFLNIFIKTLALGGWRANKNLRFMSNSKKNEELQSRREFFKKAAKAALPVVGAAILASVPFVKSEAATGCFEGGCIIYCKGSCSDGCQGGCSDSCYGSCTGTCNASCKWGCGYGCYRGGTY